ncbi:MAG: hypothetical protein IM537_16555 [Pseudanabaena sp. M57BS1SP1A06MG]|nr:hypothetical protein [Pseudanabaena sp. M53BS1SP1A06MG]MCA6581263.1 hypothetical protein [Pseudanabaena sp. M34BS1SP1A06MG]MCA6590588.1 hypothetical protein [Pseudanabaena sp. M38BS1SP1A06MG]MCA6601765.1 hypothetical protein [Pseudanabaena sp. M57BS1SP1A06MG]
MSRRRTSSQTIGEARYPDTPDFVELAKMWNPAATSILLNLIWQGYDLCFQEILSKVDVLQSDDQLERELTQILDLYIRQGMQGFEPFILQHESYEMELRGAYRPRQYDLAFVWFTNPKIKYPLEAKVLRLDISVNEYVNEITSNFLTCQYSPFSSQGAMLGYLLQGNTATAFKNIATSVPCTLSDHPDFVGRDHKISDHQRVVPEDKTYPDKFRCHHLLLQLSKEPNVKQASRKRKSQKN